MRPSRTERNCAPRSSTCATSASMISIAAVSRWNRPSLECRKRCVESLQVRQWPLAVSRCSRHRLSRASPAASRATHQRRHAASRSRPQTAYPLTPEFCAPMPRPVSFDALAPLPRRSCPPEQRAARCEAVQDEIGDCTRCPLAYAGRHKIVFADGDRQCAPDVCR